MATIKDYYSQTLIVLMSEIKIEDVYEDFSSDKEMFDFINLFSKSIYYDDSNKLTIGKMEDETAGVVIEEFVRLKPKMYSFLVDHDSEFKKAKDMNRNVVEKIIYNGCKDVLLNKMFEKFNQ